jgi:hypothetical protein
MRRRLHRLILLTAIGLVLCPAACTFGPERIPETGATLEGTVTYGKDKILVAMIIAQGDGRTPAATGSIDDDGRYKLVNVPLGEVNIAVNVDAGRGQLQSKIQARAQTKSNDPIPPVINIPNKYAEPGTSGLKKTIVTGENTFDIVIPK